jgi:mevalonate kinase
VFRGSSTPETHHDTRHTDAQTGTASGAAKGVATLRRHAEERRAEKLMDMRAQMANGTLVIRQMTPAELDIASATARRTLARNVARTRARS